MPAITYNPPTINDPSEALEDVANSMTTTGNLMMTALGQIETVEGYISKGMADVAKSAAHDVWSTIWAAHCRNKIDADTAFAIREKLDDSAPATVAESRGSDYDLKLAAYRAIELEIASRPGDDDVSQALVDRSDEALWAFCEVLPAYMAQLIEKYAIMSKECLMNDRRGVDIIARDLHHLATDHGN